MHTPSAEGALRMTCQEPCSGETFLCLCEFGPWPWHISLLPRVSSFIPELSSCLRSPWSFAVSSWE